MRKAVQRARRAARFREIADSFAATIPDVPQDDISQLAESTINEDLVREAGYMLPQNKNTHDLLSSWLENPPSATFPVETAKNDWNSSLVTI